MSAHLKAAIAMAVGSVIAVVLWAVTRKILVVRGVVPDGEAGPVAKVALFALFFVFCLSIVPLFIHVFVVMQGGIGNADLGLVRLLREHELGVTLAAWGFLTTGMLIALPVMWTDFFGFTPTVGRSQGALVADVGLTLAEVAARSSLRIAPGAHESLTGSSRSAGKAVFDFEVANAALRFERCRYYWLETGSHDDPKIVHINVGISTRKLPRATLDAEREAMIRRLRESGWAPGHFEFTDPARITLHGGTREGDGIYWAHGDTLLVLRENRVDESKRGEDPQTAGEFIEYVELVSRHSSNYSNLVYETPPGIVPWSVNERRRSTRSMIPTPPLSCRGSSERKRVGEPPLAHARGSTGQIKACLEISVLWRRPWRTKIRRVVGVFQFAIVSGLIAAGADSLDADFLRAVGSGDIARVKALLDAGAHIDVKGLNGSFALETAIDQASSAIATLLLERGANVNLVDDFNTTALIAAARNGREEVVEPLLARHADVHAGHDGAVVAAVHNADLKLVGRLLEAGADPNAKDDNGSTLLMGAVRSPEITKLLLGHGAAFDPNATDNTGTTMLMYAAATCSVENVKTLLERGANLQARDRNGRTILMRLPLNPLGDPPARLPEMIKFVVGRGVDANALDRDGKTALHLAVESHVTEAGGRVAHRDVVLALLDAGADINRKNGRGDTALHLILTAVPARPEVARLLIERGADPNSANQEGETPGMIAAQKADAGIVQLLLDQHADPNVVSVAGDTALRFAVESGRGDIVQVFLNSGAVRFAAQPYRNSAEAMKAVQEFRLMSCAERGDLREVKQLLDNNADVNARDRHGRTPLMYAAESYRSSPDVVAVLLDRKADIAAQNNEGDTALALAAANNQPDLVRLLIEKGADLNVRNKRGRTPLLASIDSQRCARLLLEHQVDLAARDVDGKTALHLAVAGSGNGDELARLLVGKGAVVDATDAKGWTPLMSAIESLNVIAVEYLLSQGAKPDIRATDGSTPLSLAISTKARGNLSPYDVTALERMVLLIRRTSPDGAKIKGIKP